ncbi:MAG: hypothetical protein RJB39_105 [Candidatus Parcubacteria bacterium]|jgi:LPXTG-site transpeptidase (sortase) family protein
MALEVFSESEKKFLKKLTIVGLIVVCAVALLSGLAQVINVYQTEGSTGLRRLVAQGDTENTGQKVVEFNQSVEKTVGVQTNVGELPLYIEVPSLDIQSEVEAPTTMTVSVLDAALNRGPVYYQGSGSPGDRNMLIFGHSTGFSIVHNKAYKVFNEIKNAKTGALVYIRTSSGVHTYRTINVKKVSKYNAWIQFNSAKPLLTLATCDSFGKASDRWVLEAEYIGFEKR